jgi:hypothetical protein
MTATGEPAALAAAAFCCAQCGRPAGSIRAFDDPPRIRIETERRTTWIAPEALPAFRAAAAAGPGALFALDLEHVPTWCPVCGVTYCGDHWRTWLKFDDDEPSWMDSVRGTCPHGHERMIED